MTRAKRGQDAISDAVKAWADEAIQRFNREVIGDPAEYYTARYRGRYLYLDRANFGMPSPVCRLAYTGDTARWDFAIYKYSDERYDADEWFFPGAECVDGTIEGAMRAGLQAYP